MEEKTSERVSPEALIACWRLFETHPTFLACRNFISSKVIPPRIQFQNRTSKTRLAESHIQEISANFAPFMEKTIDNVIVQGFVCWYSRRVSERTQHPAPQILDWRACDFVLEVRRRGFCFAARH